MNRYGEAYSTLQMLIEDWASEYDLAKRADLLARHVADVVFDEFLMIDTDKIETEDE